MRVAAKETESGLVVASETTIGFASGEILELDLEPPDTGEGEGEAVSGKSVKLSPYYGEMERRGRPERS